MNDAQKEFERTDEINAGKRADELIKYVGQYKSALRQMELAKAGLKAVIKTAAGHGFKQEMLDAVLTGYSVFGVEKMAFLSVINQEQNTDNDPEVNVCVE